MRKTIEIIRSPAAMMACSAELKAKGMRLGLVPTMGCLHDGHLSLIRLLDGHCDVKMASIFVNPTQFGPNEDFQKYPRSEARDLRLLESVGCEIAYCPSAADVYADDFTSFVEVGPIADRLCGHFRPGHFRGVATIVLKLFNATRCDAAVFGLKDYQQAVVIRRMVKDLDLNVELLFGETAREADGLAMSSRNSYLSQEERQRAAAIPQALETARTMAEKGESNVERIIYSARNVLLNSQIDSIQYLEIVDPESLEPLPKIDRCGLIVLAVYVGKTRLIDNVLIGPAVRGKPLIANIV